MVVQLIEKWHTLEVAVNRFFTRIEALDKKGLPYLFVINEKLMTKEDYKKKLQYISKDTTKSSHINGVMTRRAFYEAINNMSLIQHEIKQIFCSETHFHSVYRGRWDLPQGKKKNSILDKEWWDKLCEFQD